MAPSDTIQAAKDRLTSAERWAASASEMLQSAEAQAREIVKAAKSQTEKSQKEVKDAKEYLKSVEEKFEVIEINSDNDSVGSDSSSSSGTEEMQICVNVLFIGRENSLDVEPSDTIAVIGKTYSLDVKPSDTIGDVKLLLESKFRFPFMEQRLTFAGKKCKTRHTLDYYNVQDESTLDLQLVS